MLLESNGCFLRALKTKHYFVYRNPIHSTLYVIFWKKMAGSLMKTKQCPYYGQEYFKHHINKELEAEFIISYDYILQ